MNRIFFPLDTSEWRSINAGWRGPSGFCLQKKALCYHDTAASFHRALGFRHLACIFSVLVSVLRQVWVIRSFYKATSQTSLLVTLKSLCIPHGASVVKEDWASRVISKRHTHRATCVPYIITPDKNKRNSSAIIKHISHRIPARQWYGNHIF